MHFVSFLSQLIWQEYNLTLCPSTTVKVSYSSDFHITSTEGVAGQIDEYVKFFNEERPAYALEYLTPKQYREKYGF